ncbi:MAG: hypothetical protein A4E19_21135 [Nitrospira sp. SG-bin1]|nr:MAG: hypothetical protein A4E19_21135 [Nitrospira sp. SG-bin1]
MTIYKHFTAICVGFAAWSWFTVGANGQEGQPTPPQNTSRPAAVVSTSDIPWHDLTWVERRYKIEAMRFKARDETGIDWPGSDEVMVGVSDMEGYAHSNEIGDIDSGDTHRFDPEKSCIVAVRPGEVILGETSLCDDVGRPAPLNFRVELWEQDFPYPSFGFENYVCSDSTKHHYTGHCLHEYYDGDDFIGSAQVDLSIHDLEIGLPNVGDEYIETIVLKPCRGADVCDVTYGPDYSFTYRITRLPDVKMGLHGVLTEAMRKIGARSELEAIAAGLRALRAPSPRKVESEGGAMPIKR